MQNLLPRLEGGGDRLSRIEKKQQCCGVAQTNGFLRREVGYVFGARDDIMALDHTDGFKRPPGPIDTFHEKVCENNLKPKDAGSP